MKEDEIDIQELAVSIIRFFKRNLRFFFLNICIGIAIGAIIYFLLPKIHKGRMLIMSDILTQSYSKEIADGLNDLIRYKDHKALASQLEIAEQEARRIKSIEIEGIAEGAKKEDTRETQSITFIITVKIVDGSPLPGIQNGIISFLRNKEFIKIRVRQRMETYQKLNDKIEIEINSLDSLKQKLFNGKPIYSKSAEMMLVDPTSIYSTIIELNKERLNLKNKLELADGIQLVEGFRVFEIPSSPDLRFLLLGGLVGGFLLALVLLSLFKLIKLANQQP